MEVNNYETVLAHADISGHHGGAAVVYKADEDALIEPGYYVVDAEEETVVQRAIPLRNAGYAYGVAEGYDRAVGAY